MDVIEFNGLGLPNNSRFGSGTIAILIQSEEISVVRIELLLPEEFGPSLEHAINNRDLELSAREAVAKAFPTGLDASRHWLLECPFSIAERAQFSETSNG